MGLRPEQNAFSAPIPKATDAWAGIATDAHEGIGQLLDTNARSIFRGNVESDVAATEPLPAFALVSGNHLLAQGGRRGGNLDQLNKEFTDTGARRASFDTLMGAVAGEDVQWQHLNNQNVRRT